MNMPTWLTRYFNKYTLVARLLPAILLIAPIFLFVVVVFPAVLSGLQKPGILILVVLAALIFLSNLARSRGKIVEDRLLVQWGGWPTTLFLRHRDPTIDHMTKGRYHGALAKMLGHPLPTEAEEARDPAQADVVYRSATKDLIEKRRGKAYQMVHDENASYGFRRNLRGLKVQAIAVALLAAVATAVAWFVVTQHLDGQALRETLRSHPIVPALVGGDLLYALILAWGVNDQFVRQGANEYALALLRTLEPPAARTRRTAKAE
jgi:hypothetical protein